MPKPLTGEQLIEKAIQQGDYFRLNLEGWEGLRSVQAILKNSFYKHFYTIDAYERLPEYMENLREDQRRPRRDKSVLAKMNQYLIKEADAFCQLVEKAKQEKTQIENKQAYRQFEAEGDFEKYLYTSIRSQFEPSDDNSRNHYADI